MSNDTVEGRDSARAEVPEVLERYLEMWSERDGERRRRLIDECVSEDMIFADPRDYHEGRDALFTNTNRFRKLFPGAVLMRTSHVDTQHRRHRYTWRIELDGELLIEGMDVTTLDEAGLIERIDGFFGPIRPLN